MSRNYKTLEGTELERLAPLGGPTGRKARAELARRETVGTLIAAGEVVVGRRDLAREEFDRSVEAMVAKAPEVATPKARTTRKK
jgi:hypothetical protein